MPNWCHNTLTVRGESGELRHFVETVRESDEQPLSFAKLVPEPTEEEYAAMDEQNKVLCRMCAGHGDLPASQEQASERGANWYPWMDPAEREDRTCNVCSGEGRALPSLVGSAWRLWRGTNWGCKWDASFSGPFLALGAEGATVDACVEAQGATLTPEVAVYKFDTPWAPASPFVEAASEQFPELEFEMRFGEPGVGFAGVERYVGGLCVEQEEREIDEILAPEEMWF